MNRENEAIVYHSRWVSYEHQLQALLKGFEKFLPSPITANCFNVFIAIHEFVNLAKLLVLVRIIGVDAVQVNEEMWELWTKTT